MERMNPSVVSIVRLHYHLEEGNLASHLAEDFVFDTGFETIPRDEYLVVQRGVGAIESFQVQDAFAAADRAAIMFEGTDSVTGLFHRYCWLVTFNREKVTRISACAANLPSPDSARTTAANGPPTR